MIPVQFIELTCPDLIIVMIVMIILESSSTVLSSLYFLQENFNKFLESKCYFVGYFVFVLDIVPVVKLPLTNSAEGPPPQ